MTKMVCGKHTRFECGHPARASGAMALFLIGAIFMSAAILSATAQADTKNNTQNNNTQNNAGETFEGPRIESVPIDWAAARGNADLAQRNATSRQLFPAIAESSVPVLLPLDTEALARDAASGPIKSAEHYLSGFRSSRFFLAGPAGYDAIFTFAPASVPGFGDIRLANPVVVTMSGFSFIYDLPPPNGAVERPVPRELADAFPGIKRQILESTLRYNFERHGVPYAVTIQCHDGRHTIRRLSCRNAERIALRFLQALSFAGGSEQPAPEMGKITPAARPAHVSSVFTYHPAGSLIPGTGVKGEDGNPDKTVYARIRFPVRHAPAFANSQSFMHWGDCDQTGMRPRPRGKNSSYACRVSGKPLVFSEAATENYSYPWRDNFCEHRHFYVGQCPSGLGHQGQDIRPANCVMRNEGADRCQPYQHDVVAVRDGMVLREDWQESVFLYVNNANERLRFRYLHMQPARMDADRILSGRNLREGEVISQLGNYNQRDNGTTNHLHFELHVPTRDGWVRVNPYMTLVAGYEHLIQARGTEITDPADAPQLIAAHEEATAAKAAKQAAKSRVAKPKPDRSRRKARPSRQRR